MLKSWLLFTLGAFYLRLEGRGGGGEGGLGDEEKIFPEKLSQKATSLNVKAKKIIMHQDQSQ